MGNRRNHLKTKKKRIKNKIQQNKEEINEKKLIKKRSLQFKSRYIAHSSFVASHQLVLKDIEKN